MNIDNALAKLDMLLKDAGYLDAADKLEAINDALKKYSKDRPRVVTADFTGDGSTYEWPLPTNFISGLSLLNSVEYPADEEEPIYLRNTEYTIYLKSTTSANGEVSSTEYLRLIDAPAENEVVRIQYTTEHSLSSIPEFHEPGIIYYAASLCFRILSARFAQSKDSMIDADIVDHREKTDRYLRLAEEYERKYREIIGLERSNTSYTAYANWHTELPEGYGDYLYHRKRYR